MFLSRKSSESKSFCPAFFKKLVVSKGKAFGRSNERNGGVGAAAHAQSSFRKVFWQAFSTKKLGRLKAA
ncbi:MAG: hypothetical protein ACI4JM_05330 [Oscillospiraceae bacterium]